MTETIIIYESGVFEKTLAHHVIYNDSVLILYDDNGVPIYKVNIENVKTFLIK